MVQIVSNRELTASRKPIRLTVIASHPIQYYAPWFVYLATRPEIALKVFYLWDGGVNVTLDRDFGVSFKWDIPLLDGYEFEFVKNVSADPGTHHFRGLDNPELAGRLIEWRPDAVLMFGYNFLSHLRLIFSPAFRNVPIVLRGDSHNLGRPGGVKTLLKKILRRVIFRRMAAFLAVGKANGQYFKECARNSSLVFFAPHFVDNERFREDQPASEEAANVWRRELGIPHDAFVFGFVGKFEEKKRPLDFLKASEIIRRQGRNFHDRTPVFLFVGAGSDSEELLASASDRIGKDVFFAPFQNQRRMPVVYATLDVLVLPVGDRPELTHFKQ